MDRLLYVAMSGAKETLLAQAVNTHNLANASTTGFRADLEAMKSLPVYGPGQPSRVYALDEGRGVDLTPGALVQTGRALDVAVTGNGLIAVQAPDGNEAYTRAGELQVDSLGLLSNGAGHPVMGNAGPIALPPFEKIEIGADGTLSLQPLGQGPETLAVVDRIKLVNPDPGTLVKGEDGLLRSKDGTTAPADAAVQLATGAVEGSNVNAVDAMVNLIQLARQFEAQVKMMKTAEEADRASAEMLRIS